jgi:hypothetical protein
MANLFVSTGLRNAMMDTTGFNAIFNSGTLEIRDGSQPANADQAPVGTVLASVALPADAFNAASAGAVTKLGTWEDTSADATGTATWFRLKASGDLGTTNTTDERIDGDVTATSGGGDLELDNTSISSGQQVTINTFTVTFPAS